MRVAPLVELASGVDALYLSGRAALPADLLDLLESARIEASLLNAPVSVELGPVAMVLQPRAWLKYRYCLDHAYGRIGFTTSGHLPAVRVQPRAEFLHGCGVEDAVEWFQDVLEQCCGPVRLSVTRVDLYADFQRWDLRGDDRAAFICRARSLNLHEEDQEFTGLTFGRRKTGTVSARIYDKTAEIAKSGKAYWTGLWGDAFDPSERVVRVEFEIARAALRELKLSAPEEVLRATGAIWTILTTGWLTHRTPTDDQTKSRWPISPEWTSVQRAHVGEDPGGVERTYAASREGQVSILLPQLVGYLASFGALTQSESFGDVVTSLADYQSRYAHKTGLTLSERIALKRQRYGIA